MARIRKKDMATQFIGDSFGSKGGGQFTRPTPMKNPFPNKPFPVQRPGPNVKPNVKPYAASKPTDPTPIVTKPNTKTPVANGLSFLTTPGFGNLNAINNNPSNFNQGVNAANTIDNNLYFQSRGFNNPNANNNIVQNPSMFSSNMTNAGFKQPDASIQPAPGNIPDMNIQPAPGITPNAFAQATQFIAPEIMQQNASVQNSAFMPTQGFAQGGDLMNDVVRAMVKPKPKPKPKTQTYKPNTPVTPTPTPTPVITSPSPSQTQPENTGGGTSGGTGGGTGGGRGSGTGGGRGSGTSGGTSGGRGGGTSYKRLKKSYDKPNMPSKKTGYSSWQPMFEGTGKQPQLPSTLNGIIRSNKYND